MKTSKPLRRRDLLAVTAIGGSAGAVAAIAQSSAASPAASTFDDEIPDVLIVGAGNAGIPAAIQAADLGAQVLVLEKTSMVGGMLMISGGHVSAANTKLQIAKNIEDSPQDHYRDAVRLGNYKCNSDLLKVAVENATAMVDWLGEIGVEFTPASPFLEDDHEHYSAARTYVGPDYARSLLFPFRKELDRRIERGDIEVRTEMRVTQLIKNNAGAVIGVNAEDSSGKLHQFLAKTVILTTGGYAANTEMKKEFNPAVVPAKVICLPHATGDGTRMARQAGARLVNMDWLIAHPGPIQDPSGGPTRARLQFPPDHETDGIWVNQQGQRFINEPTDSPDERERALLEQPGLVFFLIFDENIRRNLSSLDIRSWSKEQFDKEIETGEVILRADSITELAAKFGINGKQLNATTQRFNQFVATSVDEDFGRERLRFPVTKPPFYGVRVTGSLLISHGGISVNHNLQVKHENDRIIAGLYAAGETLGCGQLMGEAVLSGMSVGPAITLGRIAARNAYQYAQQRQPAELRPAVVATS